MTEIIHRIRKVYMTVNPFGTCDVVIARTGGPQTQPPVDPGLWQFIITPRSYYRERRYLNVSDASVIRLQNATPPKPTAINGDSVIYEIHG